MAKIRAEARAGLADEGFPVHPVNVPAVKLFLALSTQWRTAALSTLGAARLIRTGIDYGVIEPTARMAGLETDSDTFTRLRLMEQEALRALAERND